MLYLFYYSILFHTHITTQNSIKQYGEICKILNLLYTYFLGLLTNSDNTLQAPSTPSTSPTRILEEEKNQWLSSEVTELNIFT